MFSGKKANFVKLRTNLRLCINRLKLLEKKKAELALKSRREIADYISNGKDDRARIRVEHIIREDYMVEAMEMIEMFCDLLLARFGLIEKMKEMDPGLEEAIATILWASPRLQTDVQELKEVTHQLTNKYGKEFTDQCVKNGLDNVNEKVMVKMGLHAPPSMLIENYMIEIAKAYNVPYTPDMAALEGTQDNVANDLIEIGLPSAPDKKDPKGPGGGGAFGGGGGFNYPGPGGGGGGSGGFNYPGPGGGGGGGSQRAATMYHEPPPFQPGSSAYYPGESAPPYEETQSGASGLVPGRPLVGPDSGGTRKSPNRNSLSDRPPPPLPSQPPNSGGSSPAGKNSGSSPAGRASEEDSPVYDYAMPQTPNNLRPPGYRDIAGAGNASQGFGGVPSVSNPCYGRNPLSPTDGDITYPASDGAASSDTYQPLSPHGSGKNPTDDVYVPVLPDVPDLNSVPDANIQSGKHNTDYPRVGPPPSGGENGVHPDNQNVYIPVLPDIPSLPTVPSDSVRTDSGNTNNDDIDFDDLTKRFEALKKKK